MHGVANEQRPNGAPRTNVSEHQGEKKLDTGEKKGGKCEKAQKAVKDALEEELIAEMYEMVL